MTSHPAALRLGDQPHRTGPTVSSGAPAFIARLYHGSMLPCFLGSAAALWD